VVASVVQTSAKGFGGGGGGVASISFSFSSTPTIGNAIIVPAEVGGGTITSVTDNQATGGNTYTRKVNASQAGGPWDAEIWECPNVTKASGTFTITVTFSTNAWGAGAAIEVSGLDTAGTLDRTGTFNTGTGDTTPGVVASAANTVATDLVVALFSSASSSPTNAITGPTTGYTQIFEHEDGNSSNSGAAGYKVLSGIETSSADWTQGDNVGYAAVIATFKIASGTQSYSYTASGGMTLGGTAARVKKITKAAAGGIVLSGAAPNARGFGYLPSGGMLLGGTALRLVKRPVVPSGGLQMGGAATVSFNAGTQTYSYTASGGMLLGGVAAVLRSLKYLPTGGIVLSGTAAISTHQSTRTVIASGGFVLSGAAGVTYHHEGGDQVYLAGTAVSAFGTIQVLFLNDVTPVPAGAVFIDGIAHSADGFRFVANWPVSGIVSYVDGRAVRPDGAQIIITDPPVPYLGGYGYTTRGELCVTLSTGPNYIAGISVVDGKTSVSTTA
jgi:hypothetical protein